MSTQQPGTLSYQRAVHLLKLGPCFKTSTRTGPSTAYSYLDLHGRLGGTIRGTCCCHRLMHSADGHCQKPTGRGNVKGFALYSLKPEY